MTTPHRTLQMALDALHSGESPPNARQHDAITALREAMEAPEPEPVAYLVEGWHDGKLIAHIPHLTLEDAKASAAVFSQHYTTTKLLPLYAAPPAAPADDHATPSGGQEAGPQEDRIEAAYWRFDARHKGYSQWKTAPMSERDAFKAEMRNALESEKVRAEMRLVARGWRRPDAPAAPAPAAPAAPVPDGWVMVPREPTPEMIAAMPYPANTIPAVGVACYRAMIAASPAAPAAPVAREPRHVRKVGGSFQHTGTVVAEFRTTAGEPRIVLEFDAPVAGMLHVYRPDQVEPCEPVAPAAPPAAPAPAQPVPLTQDQIADCTRTAHRACDAKGPMTRWSTEFARAIEAALGITGGKP